MTPATTTHARLWAAAIAQDIIAHALPVTMTAISMHVPTPKQRTQWAALWRTIITVAAAARDVHIILPAASPAHPATHANTRTAEVLRAVGARVTLIEAPPLLHAKTCLIGDQIAWIGSGNYTSAASDHNAELWVRSTEPTIARDLAAFLARLTTTHGPATHETR